MSKVYIIGVGPGSSKYLAEIANEKIKEADIVVGWGLDLLPVEGLIKGKEIYLQSVDNYVEVAEKVAEEARNTDKTVAVLRVGDPCVSSGLARLLEIFNGFDIEIVPGISSIQLAAAIARVSIDESVVISFHDGGNLEEKKRFMVDALRRDRHIVMLAGPDLTPNEATKYLIANGISENTLTVLCENLTLEDEKIFKGTLRDVLTKQFSWLSVMVVISSKGHGGVKR